MLSRYQRTITVSAALFLIAACNRRPSVAVRPACPRGWTASWSGDSLISLCLPPGFTRASAHPEMWMRADSPRLGDRIIVSRIKWPEDWHEQDPWPFHLASGSNCLADCATADSLVVHTDTVGHVAAHVETGLVTGGEPDFRGDPVLVASWSPTPHVRVIAYGFAARPGTLDTLRSIARTVSVASGKP